MQGLKGQKAFRLKAIGYVETPFAQPSDAPMQGKESKLSGTITLYREYAEGIEGVRRGDRLIVLLWYHLGKRDILHVHPQGDTSRPLKGVFLTRSPHRPNPVAMCEIEVESVSATRLKVRGLDAVSGTPVIDIKPIIS